MENRKVIAITLCSRENYARQLFTALSQCYGIEDYTVLVSHDIDPEKREQCDEVQVATRDFIAPYAFYYYRNDPALGIDLNKLFIFPEAYERSDFVILMEDDTIPSKDALQWFEFAAEECKHDRQVLSIGGYNRILDVDVKDIDPYAYIAKDGFNPWMWGMWRDKYEEFVGLDGSKYLDAAGDESNGRFDWHLHENSGMRSIRPLLARTQSIGGEGGVHTPSPEWHRENEYNEVWAGLLDLPNLAKERKPPWKLVSNT